MLQAQVLSKAAARQHLANLSHRHVSDSPVIFFGTAEIAWIGLKDVVQWEKGMNMAFHTKGRKNRKFIAALDQVGTGRKGPAADRAPQSLHPQHGCAAACLNASLVFSKPGSTTSSCMHGTQS